MSAQPPPAAADSKNPPTIAVPPPHPTHHTKSSTSTTHTDRRAKLSKRLARAQAMARRELQLVTLVADNGNECTPTTGKVLKAVQKRMRSSLNNSGRNDEGKGDGDEMADTAKREEGKRNQMDVSRENERPPGPADNKRGKNPAPEPEPQAIMGNTKLPSTSIAHPPSPPSPSNTHANKQPPAVLKESTHDNVVDSVPVRVVPPAVTLANKKLQVDLDQPSASSYSTATTTSLSSTSFSSIFPSADQSLLSASIRTLPPRTRPKSRPHHTSAPVSAKIAPPPSKQAPPPPPSQHHHRHHALHQQPPRTFTIDPPRATATTTSSGLKVRDRTINDETTRQLLRQSDQRLVRLHRRLMEEKAMAEQIKPKRKKMFKKHPDPKHRPPLPDTTYHNNRPSASSLNSSIQLEWDRFLTQHGRREHIADLIATKAAQRQQRVIDKPILRNNNSDNKNTILPPPLPSPPRLPSSLLDELANDDNKNEGEKTQKRTEKRDADAGDDDEATRSEKALQNLLKMIEIIEQKSTQFLNQQQEQQTNLPSPPAPTPPSPSPPSENEHPPKSITTTPPPTQLPSHQPPPYTLTVTPQILNAVARGRRAYLKQQSETLGGWLEPSPQPPWDDLDDISHKSQIHAGPDPYTALDDITESLLEELLEDIVKETHAMADEFVERMFDEEFVAC
ncbi:hypothetical protein DFJ77DRAFT_443760 [Powellomyces hirtus]|nr:hypothetical protein DFJ77DRAFT_443760 [Powellomyces hirtus]